MSSAMPSPFPIRFKRTTDMGLVRRIMTEPAVWRMIADDGAPAVEEFQPADSPAIWYVLAYDDEELLGLFAFHPESSCAWWVHTCLLPIARGRAIPAARQMAEWIWRNTGCLRIMTTVPSFNRLALRLAQNAGMMEFGTNPRSYMKHGKLWSQTLLGISKPGVV